MKAAIVFIIVGTILIPVASGQLPNLKNTTLDFQDVTATRLVQLTTEMADNDKDIEFGDYDNDGDIDVVLAIARGDFGQRNNKLYRNDNGNLVEVSGTTVIPEFSFLDVSRRALLRDFDADGFPDLIIINDSNSGTATQTSPGRTRYYRNVNGEFFVNETTRLNDLNGSAGSGMAADFDNDGLCDIVIVTTPNQSQDRLALNNFSGVGAGQFTDITTPNLALDSSYGVHGETGDFNGDGQIDLLISNRTERTSLNSVSVIRYNNNGPDSSGPGDFRYGGPSESTEFEPTPTGFAQQLLVPGDFNADGRMDIYFGNESNLSELRFSDAILINQGNDENGKAMFSAQPFSTNQNSQTLKVDANDLDQDGRTDLAIMSITARPFIYRNTSENGEVSFVQWTPPTLTVAQQGTHANSTDLFGNSRQDLFVGARNGDFIYENQTSSNFELKQLVDGQLPDFHDIAPISVTGNTAVGEISRLTADLPVGAQVSVLIRSIGSVNLTVRQNGNTLASAQRPGLGTDQFVEFTIAEAGEIEFKILGTGLSFDGNGDGVVDLLDVAPMVDCVLGTSTNCDAFDVNDDGNISLLIVQPFVEAVLTRKTSEDFVFEILSRSD